MGKVLKLTDRELAVMQVLWDEGRAMTINEISEASSDAKLTVACVAQVIPRLMKKEAIRIKDFVTATTKYARIFVPTLTREFYVKNEMERLFGVTSKKRAFGIMGVLHMLLDTDECEDEDLLNELENYIQEKRRKRPDND